LFAVWDQVPGAAEEVAHPFSGPLLRKVDRRIFTEDEFSSLTFQGKRLNRIDSVSIDGKALDVVSKSRDHITLKLPALPSGNYTLVIESKSGKLTLSRFLTVK
jgi:hypothetical protein